MHKDRMALRSAILGAAMPNSGSTVHNGIKTERHPWDRTQLTKAEMKGKTPEEIQEMRKDKYYAHNG